MEASFSCGVCGSIVYEGDLFCSNCGREVPQDRGSVLREEGTSGILTKHQFVCAGCGASMSYDPAVGALRCPYCGSLRVEATGESKLLPPAHVVPFQITGERLGELLHRYFTRHWFGPSGLKRQGTLEGCQPVFVPCWVFSAKTNTYWTADVGDVPSWARGRWRPVFGEHQGEQQAVVINASRVLTENEISALGNFDISSARGPEVLHNTTGFVEVFVVPRKYARSMAEEKIKAQEWEVCQRLYLTGRWRRLKTNTTLREIRGRPFYMPVWILTYRYRGKLYRFLVNGQTGVLVGRVPLCWWKVTLCIVVGLLLWLVFALVAMHSG